MEAKRGEVCALPLSRVSGHRAVCAVLESTGSVGSVAVSGGLSSCSLHPVAHQ